MTVGSLAVSSFQAHYPKAEGNRLRRASSARPSANVLARRSFYPAAGRSHDAVALDDRVAAVLLVQSV